MQILLPQLLIALGVGSSFLFLPPVLFGVPWLVQLDPGCLTLGDVGLLPCIVHGAGVYKDGCFYCTERCGHSSSDGTFVAAVYVSWPWPAGQHGYQSRAPVLCSALEVKLCVSDL